MNKSDQSILERAKKRFESAVDSDSEDRRERLDDIRFVRLGKQWPEAVCRDRERPGQERPMLTINRLFQFRNQVINEIRQNTPSIHVRPVDDNADVETAEIYQGIIRHIEDVSRASQAYDTAAEWQVDCGLGYFRIITDYVDGDTFDQEIIIKRIVDPNKIYCSPYTEPDGSDMTWAFVVEEMTKDEYSAANPDVDVKNWTEGADGDAWVTKDMVRIAEYFEIKEIPKTLVQLIDGSVGFEEDLPEENKDIIFKRRKSFEKRCMWYKLEGDSITETTELPTSYIPIIPVLGSEIWVDGKRHLHGLTRFAKDPARQYNYMQSANTELLALAPRAPYIAAEGSTEGYEQQWNNANRFNLSTLTYKSFDEQGRVLPRPEREPSVPTNPGFEAAMMRSVDDMKSSMGIFDASLGNHEANQSGKAILSQQNQASIGNFHFSDNLSRSISHAGRIIVEMIPNIFDTKRIIRILGEDGAPKNVQIDPSQQGAVGESQDQESSEIQKIYNLGVGKYDVVVQTGPSYATKRQEAAASMVQASQAYPALWQVAGDLIVKNFDWPGADEISKRLKMALPTNLQEQQDNQQAADPQIEQQMNQMADMVQHLSQELQITKSHLNKEDERLDIERFRAQTERLKVTADIELRSEMNEADLHSKALANLESTLALGNTGEAQDPDEQEQQSQTVEPTQTLSPGGANE